MKFSEKDIEKIILGTAFERLNERGLDIMEYSKIYKQVNLKAYGIPDLIAVDMYRFNRNRCINITVFELKKDDITVDAYLQAVRYKAGLTYFLKSFISDPKNAVIIDICLIGKTADKDIVGMIPFANESCRIFTYSFNENGICFDPVKCEYEYDVAEDIKGVRKFFRKAAKDIINAGY